MGKRRRDADCFERRSAFPLVSVAFIVVLTLVVRATAHDESMAEIFYALAAIAVIAVMFNAPWLVRVDSRQVTIRYALRRVVIPRKSAAVVKLNRPGRFGLKGWFVADLGATRRRFYNAALGGRRAAPIIDAFRRRGYQFYDGEVAVQGAVWER